MDGLTGHAKSVEVARQQLSMESGTDIGKKKNPTGGSQHQREEEGEGARRVYWARGWAGKGEKKNGPRGLGLRWRREKERREGGPVGGEQAGAKKQVGPCRPKRGDGRREGFFQILL